MKARPYGEDRMVEASEWLEAGPAAEPNGGNSSLASGTGTTDEPSGGPGNVPGCGTSSERYAPVMAAGYETPAARSWEADGCGAYTFTRYEAPGPSRPAVSQLPVSLPSINVPEMWLGL